MSRFNGSLLFLLLHALICMPHPALAATLQAAAPADGDAPQSPAWKSSSVQHAYGLPDTKPKLKGTLAVTPDGLTFTSKSSNYSIQRRSVIAVGAGNQRVELWGMKGRLLRMERLYCIRGVGKNIATRSLDHYCAEPITAKI